MDGNMETGSSSEYILKVSREFAIYVNETRAIPRVTDGLKDAMRKALWVMRSRGKIKTLALSGAMQEQNLYVHGDASDSIGTLAAPFGNNIPLLRPHGNFGTRVDTSFKAAPRYTEVSRPPYADELIYLDAEDIEMVDNFDGSNKQPHTFLPPIPLLLVNGMAGIGNGWATNILPRDPAEVADAVVSALDGKEIKQISPKYLWCDCIVKSLGYSDKGCARWWFGGRVTVRDASTLEVTELPPEMKLEAFKEHLNGLEDEGSINGYENRSSSKISVVVSLKRGACKGWTEEQAIEFLKLRYTVTENVVVIGWAGDTIINYVFDGKTDPVSQLIAQWTDWRFGWYEKRYKRLSSGAEHKLALVRLIEECVVTGLPKKLPEMSGKSELVAEIERLNRFGATPEHVQHVAALPSYRWTGEGQGDVAREKADLLAEIARCEDLISDDAKRKQVFKDEARASKKLVAAAAKMVSEVLESDD